MRKLLTLCALAGLFTSLAMAESWRGRLIDANCYSQQDEQKNVAACDPTTQTSSFALFVEGKVYQLDEGGNTKAAAAIKDRADRSSEPDKTSSQAVMAVVSGSMNTEGKLKVDKIDVQ